MITGSGDNGLSKLALQDRRADLLNNFEPALLDAQAQAEIQRALEAAATRRRALEDGPPEHDPACDFIRTDPKKGIAFIGDLESGNGTEDFIPYKEGELRSQGMGPGGANEEIERVLAGIAERAVSAAAEEAQTPPETLALPAPDLPLPDPLAQPARRPRAPDKPRRLTGISPKTGKPVRKYKERTPKPPFVPPA